MQRALFTSDVDTTDVEMRKVFATKRKRPVRSENSSDSEADNASMNKLPPLPTAPISKNINDAIVANKSTSICAFKKKSSDQIKKSTNSKKNSTDSFFGI